MKPKILLIEDDASTAASLQKVLRSEGYDVAVCARGDQGLERAQGQFHDVVVTDLRLPGLGGLEPWSRRPWPAAGSCPNR
jgi:CheY-like chemotaxis protein